MTLWRRNGGTSLAEVLVSLLILGLVAGALHQFCRAALRGVRVLEVASEAQEAALLGVQLMAQDLRDAGFSPRGPLAGAVRQAAASAVEIVRDLNGDGDTDDPNEVIGYHLNRETRTLMRTMGHAPPQPMLADLGPAGLAFAYLAAGSEPLALAGGTLSRRDRERVRRIDIVLTVEMPNPDPAAVQPIRSTQTTSVYLRNG